MDIKQVIIVVECPSGSQRVVYGAEGEVFAGDLDQAKKLSGHDKAKLTVCARGQRGEICRAIFDSEGEPVSGDPEALAEALEDHPIAQLISPPSPKDTPDPDQGDDEGIAVGSLSSGGSTEEDSTDPLGGNEPPPGVVGS